MINVDTVYQTVQALANKEQRGYITPQEFNLFANQVQQDIFEQYLYDLNAFREKKPEEHELGDSISHILKKLDQWYDIVAVPGGVELPLPPVATGKIFLGQGANRRELKQAGPDQIRDLRASRWHRKGFTDAAVFDDGYRRIQVWDGDGQITNGISCEVITGRPGLVVWGYVVVNQQPVYDVGSSQHFYLHISEQPDVVVKILKLAGISIEAPQLYQAAGQEEQQNLQQENK